MGSKNRADAPLPAGAVTFLFTDIEGSTRLWESHAEIMQMALARHDALLRDILTDASGHVFNTVGDAFHAAFASPQDAVAAALRAQAAITHEPWPESTPLKVRMALHTGVVESRDGDYFGPPVNRVARLLSTAHGGQTLLSQATLDLCGNALPEGASTRDLGLHRLKDLARPERVFELRRPGSQDDFPPIKSLSTHPNNLPQQLTSFIGRSTDIARIAALLDRQRLVTLTGMGGSGKTRLALQVAAESLVLFPDGVWFAELAPFVDPRLVASTVASVLGVTEEPGTPIATTLAGHIAGKQLLLVVDNCEHVIDACAWLLDTLVRQCDHLRIIATSREALAIEGEQICPVRSLSLPDAAAPATAESIGTFESIQLFADRALLARPEFRITAANAPAIASICRTLDGIPLAIELAAARMRDLSVEEIDDRLDQRFALLRGGSRTALPRHQTLRALIDWSYDLLSVAERALLQWLSVFAGGFALQAVEQVCIGDSMDRVSLFDFLASLANKSLVTREENDGRSRYGLLETVRQYARDKLVEAGDQQRLRVRHRDYYVALAEAAIPELVGPAQSAWFARLADEHDNFRAALDSCMADGAPASGLRLCWALQRFWVVRGYLTEGRTWCARVLALPGAEGATRERANALHAAGSLAYYQSDYAQARAQFEESLAIRRQVDDRRGVGASLNNLGNVAIEQGDYVTARGMHEASLEIAREIGDESGIANSLLNLGVVADQCDDYAASRPLYEECLAIRRRLGDRWGIAVALNNLGIVAYMQGDYPSARTLHEESLGIRRELKDLRGTALSLGNLANLAFEQALFAWARQLSAESLAIAREIGDARQVGHSLQGLAAVDAALGQPIRAAYLWGAAERLSESIGTADRPSDYQSQIETARAAFADDANFDRAWQAGRAASAEEAVEFALHEEISAPIAGLP